ncbi:MAG: VWA domain-containing protein [Acidobacteria bacterium]|nr:VWA domain-containing protein [Acidobacteriota bacterium]
MAVVVPVRAEALHSIARVGVALALSLPGLVPSHAQNDPANIEASTSADRTEEEEVPLAPLLGPWIRNESLSEDPVLKTETTWPGQDATPVLMRKLAEQAAAQLDTVSVRIMGDSLVLLDDRGDVARYPLDGRFKGRGVSGRVIRVRDSVTIETIGADWQRIETLYRDGNRLVLINVLRDRRRRSAEFRTVYERPGRLLSTDPLPGESAAAENAAIRIVPPQRGRGELLGGRVEVQTLIIDPLIVAVEFFLDGRPVRRARKPPFSAHLQLVDPPREQTLEVRAWNTMGDFAGSHRITLNQIDMPFGVRITRIRGIQAGSFDSARVEAAISLPRTATLQRVDFHRGQERVKTLRDFGEQAAGGVARTVIVEAEMEYGSADGFVRVTATLADGRSMEDAEILQGVDYRSEIDVQLVQLQLLVTDRKGNPVSGLAPDDFEIRERGRRYRPEALLSARDVPLVLGLAIDSSDSMLRVWGEVREVAVNFLDVTLVADDRAFLVDFDDTVSLRQPLTGDKARLLRSIDRLIPFGGTAINDGILFSLLQYGREPGRRALVVVTDGADEHSRSRPEQSADYAARLGLPIYFIELDPTVTWTERRGGRVITRYPARRQKARKRLERISRETGGRLFHVPLVSDDPPWTERIEAVFDRIEEDLRNQHVLTYYSDRPLGAPVEPRVSVTRRGLRLQSAVPLEGIE